MNNQTKKCSVCVLSLSCTFFPPAVSFLHHFPKNENKKGNVKPKTKTHFECLLLCLGQSFVAGCVCVFDERQKNQLKRLERRKHVLNKVEFGYTICLLCLLIYFRGYLVSFLLACACLFALFVLLFSRCLVARYRSCSCTVAYSMCDTPFLCVRKRHSSNEKS